MRATTGWLNARSWSELVQRIENSQRLRYEQTDQYYNTRIRNLESSISVQEMNLEYAIKTNDDKLARSSEGALQIAYRSLVLIYNVFSGLNKKFIAVAGHTRFLCSR